MKFKMEFELDTDTDSACMIGEFLRKKFWPEGYGCYTNFEFGPEVKLLEPRVETLEDNFWGEGETYKVTWTRAEWQGITCEYYWDGDGFLKFIFPDGSSISNSDCKKDSYWLWDETQVPDEPVC